MKVLSNKPNLLEYLEKLEECICNLSDANHGNQLLTFFNRVLGELRPAIDEMKRRESIRWIAFLDVRREYEGDLDEMRREFEELSVTICEDLGLTREKAIKEFDKWLTESHYDMANHLPGLFEKPDFSEVRYPIMSILYKRFYATESYI